MLDSNLMSKVWATSIILFHPQCVSEDSLKFETFVRKETFREEQIFSSPDYDLADSGNDGSRVLSQRSRKGRVTTRLCPKTPDIWPRLSLFGQASSLYYSCIISVLFRHYFCIISALFLYYFGIISVLFFCSFTNSHYHQELKVWPEFWEHPDPGRHSSQTLIPVHRIDNFGLPAPL